MDIKWRTVLLHWGSLRGMWVMKRGGGRAQSKQLHQSLSLINILIHEPLLENAEMRRISESLINELFLRKCGSAGNLNYLY